MRSHKVVVVEQLVEMTRVRIQSLGNFYTELQLQFKRVLYNSGPLALEATALPTFPQPLTDTNLLNVTSRFHALRRFKLFQFR